MWKSTLIRLGFIVLLTPLALAAQQLVDGVAALVGDEVILKSDIVQIAQMNAVQSGADLAASPHLFERFQSAAFETLVLQKILLARARVDSLDVIPDEDVDQALEQQVASIVAQVGSEERFQEIFGQSLRDFKRERWFDLRNQMIAERYQAQKIAALSVTRDEVLKFFETFRDSLPPVDTALELSQLILPVRPGPQARTAALAVMGDLQLQLTQGEDFAQLARTYSDDPASQAQGGDLGFIRRGELVPVFEQTAFGLQIGQTSDIVETVFGYHIIELLDKQGERIKVRHILIAIEPTALDRENALATIRDYYFQIVDEPALFDSLVQELGSLDHASPDLGYIGWLELDRMPGEAYRSAVFGAKTGDITPPFETQQAFHILKVLNLKEGGQPTLEEYYPQIEALALRNKQSQYLEKWISRIRNLVFIKTLD